MVIIHVNIRVKPECIEAFIAATKENARLSLLEPGVARFDVLQDLDDPGHFTLVEVYRSSSDPSKHKETSHYNTWRLQAEPMMSEARTRSIFTNLFPED